MPRDFRFSSQTRTVLRRKTRQGQVYLVVRKQERLAVTDGCLARGEGILKRFSEFQLGIEPTTSV